MITRRVRRYGYRGAVHPSFTVSALNARVRVVIENGSLSPAEFDELLDVWAWCGSRENASETPVDATIRRAIRLPGETRPKGVGGDDWATSSSFRALADHLATEVTSAAIEAARGHLLMLHAAALAEPDTGRVLAFVGPSGTGKTTLSRALGGRLHYLSDETTGIAPDFRIAPYPKPLSLRVDADGRPKRQVAPSSMGLLPAVSPPYRLHRVVVLHRRADAPRHPLIEPLTVTAAIAAVTAEVSHLRALEAPMERLALACSAGGGAVRVTYCEAGDINAVLDELLAERRPTAAWQRVDTALATDARTFAERAVRRLPVADAIADDAAVAVFRNGVVRLLAGIGPVVWSAASHPTTARELTDAVIARFGEPDGVAAEAVVDAAIDELVAADVLEWVAR